MEGFGYLELCLYGIRELASLQPMRAQYLDRSRPMRVEQPDLPVERHGVVHRGGQLPALEETGPVLVSEEALLRLAPVLSVLLIVDGPGHVVTFTWNINY